MREPLLKTKIIPPRIADYILHRDRLLKLLTANLNKRIISICADAGYGKTTLLAQFVRNITIPYTWYHIDKSDQDLILFVRYLVEGMRKYASGFGKRTLSIIEHAHREIKTEILMGTFINELSELSHSRILFIFDDLQEVYEFKKIISGFEYLLNHIPPNVSIFVSTRSSLPFSLNRFHIKNESLDITQQDLKFTQDEIKILYKHVRGCAPRPSELKKLKSDSEGWITYLQFLIQPDTQRSVIGKSKKSLLMSLYDYFEREVFSPLEEELKLFLTATSVFSYFSPKACDFLLSRNDSKIMVKRLEKRHLFISSYQTPQPQYMYHHLFRNFLKKKLEETGLHQKFHNRAGSYLEKEGFFSSALKHCYEAKDYKSVARLLEKFAEDYITFGKAERIKPYVENLPKTLINSSPVLTRIKGRIYAWNCDWTRARVYYARAQRIAQQRKLHQEVLKSILVHLQMKLDLGKHRGIAKKIRKILNSKRIRTQKMRIDFLNYLAITLNLERKFKQSVPVFKEILKILKKIKNTYHTYRILHNLAVTNMEMGNFVCAQKYFEEVINKLRSNPSPTLILALNNLGHALTLQGKLSKVEEVLNEAMKYARLFNDKIKLCSSYECLGVSKILQNEFVHAEQLLKKAEHMALEIGNDWLLSITWDGMAVLAINRGNFFEAKKFSDKSLGLPIPALYKKSNLTTKVMIELALGNFDAAHKALNQAIASLKGSKHLIMGSYVQLARLYLLKRKRIRAKILIKRAIKIAEKNSYDFLLTYELKHSPEIIRFLKKSNFKTSYVQHVLLRLPYSEKTEIFVEPDVVKYDFIIRLFNSVQILKKGREIKMPSWRKRRFQEVFSFFVDNRQTEVKREKIINTFWPDHRPHIAHQLFYNALYLIRKTIIKDVIVSDKKIYSLSPKYQYWIDTEEFETLISKADRLVKDGNRAAGLIQYEEAASLYRGGFMDDFYSEWCQQRRRYFEGLYLYVLRNLAQGHYDLGNYDKALRFCKLFIDKDPYYEEAHCVAMRCYAALNDLGGLQDCFSRLKEVLAHGLKTTPRSETITLFKTLMKQRK
jgi:LuxR family maltose regulon positive regulatory protein